MLYNIGEFCSGAYRIENEGTVSMYKQDNKALTQEPACLSKARKWAMDITELKKLLNIQTAG